MTSVETVLLENIDKPDSLFVFPTDIAASGWADHLLRIKGGTVPMNKFLAWDKFKQNSVKSKVHNKKSIPSALRKIFTGRIINENKTAAADGKPPVFLSLIKVKWAQHASHFAPWLTRLLPQLGIWFKKSTGFSIDNILSDETQKAVSGFTGDDRDMYTLAKRYAQFLAEHNLFEPAWETPPFNDDGKKCFIFFPESLSDYSEYRELLSSGSRVQIINVSKTDIKKNKVFYYTNARKEITEAALYIRAIAENQKIPWNSIAVCLPDSKDYEPYVLRELENRNIPYVKRTSKPLTDYPAGRFFRSIFDCTSQNFSFTSVVSLIANKNLPWKDTVIIDKLIQFGIKNNCLYSWTENTDGKNLEINVWEDAFINPAEETDTAVQYFFNSLKKRLHSMRSAESFAGLRREYFVFRGQFLDMENCSEETDLILSRCISELMNLAELEKNFSDIPAVDPFLFFMEYLGDISYLAQSKTSGVNILPYKTAACAPFDCHIILGAGQNSLSVVHTQLDFLTRKKREDLGIFDEDASETFINLHRYNSKIPAAFFCSEQTFSGFTIAHSKINAPLKPKENYSSDPDLRNYFSADHYRNEFSSDDLQPLFLHEDQNSGFEEWKKRRKQENSVYKGVNSNSENIRELIQDKMAKNPEFHNKYSVSASSLNAYYKCSLKWLYERILGIGNVQIETSLTAENISGIVYHMVLERFLMQLKEKPLMKPVISDKSPALPESYQNLLGNCTDMVFNSFPEIPLSSLSARFLKAEKKQFMFNLEKCLVKFLSMFNGYIIKNCETWYRCEHQNYYLNGKLDCILQDIDEKYVIVDFKMASLPKRIDCIYREASGSAVNEKPADFQLPMYITLTEENTKNEVSAALFYSILDLKAEVIVGTVNDMLTGTVYPKKENDRIYRTSEIYKQLTGQFKQKVHQFMEEISTGNLTVFESDQKICYQCRFNSICRKVYIIKNEKNISLGKHINE